MVDLTQVILDRVSERKRIELGKYVVEWLISQEWHQTEWVRKIYIRVGWVVEHPRVISEWLKERDRSWKVIWLIGWSHKNYIREKEISELGEEAVEWLISQEWHQRNWGKEIYIRLGRWNGWVVEVSRKLLESEWRERTLGKEIMTRLRLMGGVFNNH